MKNVIANNVKIYDVIQGSVIVRLYSAAYVNVDIEVAYTNIFSCHVCAIQDWNLVHVNGFCRS